eukprot:TRINITY_DN8495_c0_g1_i2.p1 TRINITY_DN8495_c0_g1~~TRINITY_DN8495_c0_g1_i2.p1  ORF type:complete len:653 (+),score=110.33 TRINITY_DN8495_c0_g1_i2:326-2284(+)
MSLARVGRHFPIHKLPHRDKVAVAVTLASLVLLPILKKLKKFFAIRNNTILELDLRDKLIVDTPPSPIHEIFGEDHIFVLSELVEALDLAAKNKNIRALIVRVGKGFEVEYANIQELRNAVLRFKSSGKITMIYADTFGELHNAVGLYYFASVFNAIYLPPSGTVSIQHLVSDVPFIKGTLEKLGLSAKLGQRREYKNFANTLTEESLTPAHRESTHSLLTTVFQQIVDGISVDRNLDRDRIISAFSKSPFPASEALREGLIDGIMYSDEVYDHLHETLDLSPKKSHFLFAKSFLKTVGRRYQNKTPFYIQLAPNYSRKIALIIAEGDIHLGEGGKGDSPSIGSDSLVATLKVIIKDPSIKAIVLRVNSRGGGYVPSDLIYHEIVRAKKAGKKVVASFGNFAASGGYFIAMAADKILAQPGTLTGSIGVIYGKFLTKELCKKIGITHDFAWNGPVDSRPPPENYHSGTFYSTLHDYDERQLRTREDLLDLMYEDFTNRVAQNRGLSRNQVEDIAKGRVWLGSQALDFGLVDKLGGLDDAIREAQQLSGIPLNVTPEVVVYPKPFSLLQKILKGPPKNSEEKQKRGSGGVMSLVQNFGVIGSWLGTFKMVSGMLTSLGDLQPALKVAFAQTQSALKSSDAELLCTAPEMYMKF